MAHIKDYETHTDAQARMCIAGYSLRTIPQIFYADYYTGLSSQGFQGFLHRAFFTGLSCGRSFYEEFYFSITIFILHFFLQFP